MSSRVLRRTSFASHEPSQDPVQPHMLVSLALPHLPRPIPSIILNGMKYWQIGGVFLDDVAALLVGIGIIIWVSSWLVN